MASLTAREKNLLAIAATARMHEIDNELEYRRQTGNISEKWAMFSHSMLVHEAQALEVAIGKLQAK